MTIAIQTLKRVPPIDYTGVPKQFVGKLSAVCRTADECYELAAWFGDYNFCPNLPVMVLVPGSDAPKLIQGMGYATAAELRDCAVVAWHQGSKILDFDSARERHGLMRREDVDAATRQALLDRIAKHKANPVSDPARQPLRPRINGRKIYGRS